MNMITGVEQAGILWGRLADPEGLVGRGWEWCGNGNDISGMRRNGTVVVPLNSRPRCRRLSISLKSLPFLHSMPYSVWTSCCYRDIVSYCRTSLCIVGKLFTLCVCVCLCVLLLFGVFGHLLFMLRLSLFLRTGTGGNCYYGNRLSDRGSGMRMK